jgi:hypothetical protein
MATTAPIPWQLEIAHDLEQVLRGHGDRLARFRVDREDPVVPKEEADLMAHRVHVREDNGWLRRSTESAKVYSAKPGQLTCR